MADPQTGRGTKLHELKYKLDYKVCFDWFIFKLPNQSRVVCCSKAVYGNFMCTELEVLLPGVM